MWIVHGILRIQLTIVRAKFVGNNSMLVLWVVWAKQVGGHAAAHDDLLRMKNMAQTVELNSGVHESKTTENCQRCHKRSMSLASLVDADHLHYL